MDLLRPRWNPTVNSTAPSVASLPASVAEPFRTSIAVASDAWCALRSVPDSARSCSSARCPRPSHRPMDIDILVVSSGFPHGLVERRRPLLAAWSETCARHGVPAVEWNLVTKTPAEARHHSPLYLDIVDGILLLDRGRFFETVLDAMRARMRELGSRRVFLDDGSWYWHLEARLPVRRGGRDMTSARMGRLYIDEHRRGREPGRAGAPRRRTRAPGHRRAGGAGVRRAVPEGRPAPPRGRAGPDPRHRRAAAP